MNDQIYTLISDLRDRNNQTLVLHNVEGSKGPHLPVGLKFTLNLSNTNFNKGYPKPIMPVETVWKIGFCGGAFLEFPIFSKVTLQQEYLFTYLRSELVKEETEFRLGYFSLPILFKVEIKSKFSVMAGPQVDVLIQSKEYFKGISFNIIKDVEKRQIGVAVGTTYKFSNVLGIDIRYVHGLNHVGMRQSGSIREFKLEQIQLSAFISPF